MKSPSTPAILILEDGTEYQGFSFGHEASIAGEVVFTTGMTGYPQSLTDPSYKGQILVSTYPMVGNYGIPGNAKDAFGIPLFFESDRVQVTALVVSEYCDQPSHYQNELTLGQWLKKHKVPGICGVDTRAITERLRDRGTMRGKIVVEGKGDKKLESGDIANPVAMVSCTERIVYEPLPAPEGKRALDARGCCDRTGEGLTVCLIDCGVKNNIIRCFLERGTRVIRVPWDWDVSKEQYDGLFISNGPGDPKACVPTIAHVRKALSGNKPVFGICLGNQIVGLAAGGDTYKLPFGHRSQNQPAVEQGTRRCFITSQNHGYAVRAESLQGDWEPWFLNGNDNTVEGLRHRTKRQFTVQFHPEGCPGPRDTEYLFDFFHDAIRASKGGK